MTAIDITGERFNHWLVLGRSDYTDKTGRLFWSCRCDCGVIKNIRHHELTSESSKSCGCVNRHNLKGLRFENWTVLEYTGGNRRSKWLCRCDCGTEREVMTQNLVNGRSTNCGCIQKEHLRNANTLPKGEANFNKFYRMYKINAKKRDLLFNLTKEEFRNITKKNCNYCGAEPREIDACGSRLNGLYAGNGIDRVDNDKGYIAGNIVPCCSQCNFAKRMMSKSDFLSWIERVYAHNHHV